MTMILRIAVILTGMFFLLPGFVGVFRPERLADTLMLAPEAAGGWVAIRVLIGAPYIAMGLVTLYAAVRGRWAWLVPVAAIEGIMAATRIVSGFLDGFEAAGVHLIGVELLICIVLSLGAILPARSRA
jgi:hypothetical protein